MNSTLEQEKTSNYFLDLIPMDGGFLGFYPPLGLLLVMVQPGQQGYTQNNSNTMCKGFRQLSVVVVPSYKALCILCVDAINYFSSLNCLNEFAISLANWAAFPVWCDS